MPKTDEKITPGKSDEDEFQDSQSNPAIDKVYTQASIKIPAFSVRNPDLWFLQVESHFIAQRVTSDSTKFHTVVSQLPENIAVSVIDLLKNAPSDDKYKTLKDRLIKDYADSDQSRIRKLLSKITLGDRKPSAVLNQMQQCNLNNQIGDEIIKALWLDCLPETAKAILSVSNDPLPQLAIMADKIMETAQFQVMSSHVGTKSDNSDVNTSSLEEKLNHIIYRIDKLERPSRSRTPYRNRYNSQPRSPSLHRSKSKPKFDQCFFHFKFGNNARKCRPWCKFNDKKQNVNQSGN